MPHFQHDQRLAAQVGQGIFQKTAHNVQPVSSAIERGGWVVLHLGRDSLTFRYIGQIGQHQVKEPGRWLHSSFFRGVPCGEQVAAIGSDTRAQAGGILQGEGKGRF